VKEKSTLINERKTALFLLAVLADFQVVNPCCPRFGWEKLFVKNCVFNCHSFSDGM
jgi:hypothetical protein